jgi:hypothetical protein
LGLVGTRYFESALAETVILHPADHDMLGLLTPDIHTVSFDSGLSDFSEKLRFALSDSLEVKERILSAGALVEEFHLWDHRVKALTEALCAQ